MFKRWREYQQLKNEKLRAELTNLKHQISPHFFFNTLNNLYGLINKDTEKSREYVLKLSDLMRYAIYSGEHELVSLKEELSYLENFIALHEIRYHNKVSIDFQKDIQNDQIQIAPLLLIILLENAFKHGAETLTKDVFIELILRADEASIYFAVKNNFDPTMAVSKPGVGLDNLRTRLELLYPMRHQLNILQEENTFEVTLSIEL